MTASQQHSGNGDGGGTMFGLRPGPGNTKDQVHAAPPPLAESMVANGRLFAASSVCEESTASLSQLL
jgi:hypothetical protein